MILNRFLTYKTLVMDISLIGKNALVCGASKGIGKAAAIEIARLGANVILLARSEAILKQVKNELQTSEGQSHQYLVADFNDLPDLKAKIKELANTNTIHILINNTGGPAGGPIVEAKIDQFQSAIHNHLLANHTISQILIPGMKEAGYGRIINIISTSVKAPLDGLGVSNTTRGAVASWGKTMANELAQFGITVNNVLPGATETGRLKEVIQVNAEQNGISEAEMAQKWKNSIPMGRFGRPQELGNVIAFLASPAASYVTGVNLPVDGGRTRAM